MVVIAMEVMQGSDFSVLVTLTNRSNSAIDLTGSTAKAVLKSRVSDADSAALVSLFSSSNPELFDTSSGSGRMYVTFPGSTTSGVEVVDKLTAHAQILVKLGSSIYRTPNVPVVLIESAIKSDI